MGCNLKWPNSSKRTSLEKVRSNNHNKPYQNRKISYQGQQRKTRVSLNYCFQVNLTFIGLFKQKSWNMIKF